MLMILENGDRISVSFVKKSLTGSWFFIFAK